MSIKPVDTRGLATAAALSAVTIGESDPAAGTQPLGTILDDLVTAVTAVAEAGNAVRVEAALSALNAFATAARDLAL